MPDDPLVVYLVLTTQSDRFNSDSWKSLVAGLIVGLVALFSSSLGTIFYTSEEMVTRQRVEDADQFGGAFEKVLDRLNCKRLIIAFDDLDRCSPDKVTQMLATVKTFLEPRSEGREVVFLIAAAEDELRRHLIAQEMAAGGGGVSGAQTTAIPREVRNAVDEYLRKFFNSKIRLPDVLDEDVRAFARRELADFVSRRQISQDLSRRYCKLIQTGEAVPHPMHWHGFSRLGETDYDVEDPVLGGVPAPGLPGRGGCI